MAEAAVRQSPPTMEEALDAIQARKAERNGVDSWKVKVQRKAGLGSTLVHIATLEEATIDHLANPEQWLPMLCGGGPIFVLSVAHATDVMPFVFYSPANLNGAPKPTIDPNIVKDPKWRGPPVITYPATGDVAPMPTPVSVELEGIRRMLGVAPTETSASVSRGQDGKSAGGDSGLSEIAKLERRMETEAIARALAESQRKTDEAMRATNAQIAALTESIKAIATAPRAASKSFGEILAEATPFVAALGGLVIPLITTSREASTAEATRRENDATRRQEREDKARDELMKILAAAQEKAAASGTDMMKIVSPLVEAVSAASRVTLQNIATMRELTAGEPQDDGFAGILKAGIGALGEYMAAKASAGGGGPPQLPQRQLMAPRPVQPLGQPQGQPMPAAEAPGEGGGPSGEPEKPGEGGEAPADPTAQPAPADEAAEIAAEQAYLRTAPVEDILGHTVAAIQREHDPKELAESFLDAMALNPGVMAAVQQAKGPLPLFRSRLGDDWLKAHLGYVQRLISTLSTAAKARQSAGRK